LIIPSNTELVILPKKDVKLLISEACFDKLSKLTTLTCEDLVDCLGGFSSEKRIVEFPQPEKKKKKIEGKMEFPQPEEETKEKKLKRENYNNVSDILSKHGYYIQNVEAKGECLYLSIGIQIGKNISQVKEIIKANLLSNKDLQDKLVGDPSPDKKINDYIKDMDKTEHYGDEVEIMAFSGTCDKNIICISWKDGHEVIYLFKDKAANESDMDSIVGQLKDSILLYYDGVNHYQYIKQTNVDTKKEETKKIETKKWIILGGKYDEIEMAEVDVSSDDNICKALEIKKEEFGGFFRDSDHKKKSNTPTCNR